MPPQVPFGPQAAHGSSQKMDSNMPTRLHPALLVPAFKLSFVAASLFEPVAVKGL